MRQLLDNKTAERYASALFDIARYSDEVEGVYGDFKSFIDICSNEPCFTEFLSRPFIDKKERMKVIGLLGKELSLSPVFISFMYLLIDNGRMVYLSKIFNEFSRLKDDILGILTVRVVSAKKLKDDETDGIRNMIKKAVNKRIIINEEVAPEILGGYIINIDGKLYDSSIKTGIKNLYNYLKRGAFAYGD